MEAPFMSGGFQLLGYRYRKEQIWQLTILQDRLSMFGNIRSIFNRLASTFAVVRTESFDKLLDYCFGGC